jgi:predicted acetyltransferase
MTVLNLIAPTVEYRAEYLEMIAEWKQAGESFTPWVLNEDSSDFEVMVRRFEGYSRGTGVREGAVPHSTFWLVRDDRKVLGAVNIRHYLNDALRFSGGHIGYGVRPGERRKGYATEMLSQALVIARGLGIARAMLTCDKENIASARTILRNGGVLDSEDVGKDGRRFQRYRIEIK